MYLRTGLLLLLCCLCASVRLTGLESATWSGAIEVTETLMRPVPSKRDLQQLNDLMTVLEGRIVIRRAQHKQSQDPERRRIEDDIYALEQDLREIQEAVGGAHQLSRTRFVLLNCPVVGTDYERLQTRARADLGGGVLIANWSERLMRGRDRWGNFDGALPLKEVEVFQPEPQDGELWAGKPTLLMQVVSVEGEWQVEYIPEIPNPWAPLVTTDLALDSYPVQFARVPGLPVRCWRNISSGGQVVIAVTGIDASQPDEALFANP